MANHPKDNARVEISCFRLSAWGCGIIGALAAAGCLWTDSCTLLIEAFLYIVDAAVAIVSLVIVRTLESPPDERFPFGYHKLEPAVVNASATLLIAGSLIAVLLAIQDIRHPDNIAAYPIALGFAATATIISASLWLRIRAAQNAVGSPLLKTEALTWGIAAIESVGVLASYAVAWVLERQSGSGLQWLAFVDPVMAIILGIAILKEPLKTLTGKLRRPARRKLSVGRATGRKQVATVLAQRCPRVQFGAVRLRRASVTFVHVELALPNELTVFEIPGVQSQIGQPIRAARRKTLLVIQAMKMADTCRTPQAQF